MKELLKNTKSFLIKCKRVWHVLKKPSKREFKAVSKVSAMGIIALGLIGFIISIIIKGIISY